LLGWGTVVRISHIHLKISTPTLGGKLGKWQAQKWQQQERQVTVTKHCPSQRTLRRDESFAKCYTRNVHSQQRKERLLSKPLLIDC
jgi:hypothetical protein